MKNNKGLSYVELLVVITLLIILTSVSALSLGYMTRTNAAKAADKLQTALATSRTYCMAKGYTNGSLYIRAVGSSYEYAIGNQANLNYESLTSSPVQIAYITDDGGEQLIVPANGAIEIRFNPSNGSVYPDSSLNGVTITGFKIYRSGDLYGTVQLYTLTGKSEVIVQ